MPGRISPGFHEPGMFRPERVEQPGGGWAGTSSAAAPSRGAVTTYYVDPVNGSDSNNGLGPDASHATNKPWKTMGKALGASGITSGSICYMAPGVFRESVTVNMTAATAETFIIADPANAQGFKTSGGVLVQPGQVQWTVYTTNDKTTTPDNPCISIGTRGFLTFQGIYFVGGSTGNARCVLSTDARNLTFRDCSFVALLAQPLRVAPTFAFSGLNLLIDRCFFRSASQAAIVIIPVKGADSRLDVIIRNCVLEAQSGVDIGPTGTGTAGISTLIQNCLTVGGGNAVTVSQPGGSTSYPVVVRNCVLMHQSTGLNATTQGNIVEDYNIIYSGTARTNVTAGANSISNLSYAPLFHFGQEVQWGAQLRRSGLPLSASPWTAFGVGDLAEDIFGMPRPGGTSSVLGSAGAFERSNSWGRETTTVRTGSNALSITGPGTHDFDIAVDASATTVSCYVRKDTSYVGPPPALRIVNGYEAGVPDQVGVMYSAAPDTWEQVSVTFTPTSKGIVTVRLVSSDRAGTGKAFADDFAVA